MKSEDLYEAVGDISEKHILAARAPAKKKKPLWVKWGAVAACLALVVAGTGILLQQGSRDSGLSEGGAYSVAVYPGGERAEDVASAEVTSLMESEALGHELAKYLPAQLPDGFHYGRGSIYDTLMKDGTQYHMLRIEYISGAIPEEQFTADGGAIAPDLEAMGDLFTLCVMNYKPETDIGIYASKEEITASLLEENGAAYLRCGDCYVGVFLETAKPETVWEALRSIPADE